MGLSFTHSPERKATCNFFLAKTQLDFPFRFIFLAKTTIMTFKQG